LLSGAWRGSTSGYGVGKGVDLSGEVKRRGGIGQWDLPPPLCIVAIERVRIVENAESAPRSVNMDRAWMGRPAAARMVTVSVPGATPTEETLSRQVSGERLLVVEDCGDRTVGELHDDMLSLQVRTRPITTSEDLGDWASREPGQDVDEMNSVIN